MAGRPRLRRALTVWMNGQRVGRWTIAGQGVHSFGYERSWIESAQARPLSLSLPLPLPLPFRPGNQTQRGARVQSFFDHLLPAAALPRQRLQALFGVTAPSSFDLLSVLGRDCVGAVQLCTEGADPGDSHAVEGEALTERELSRLLDTLASEPGTPAAPDVELPAVALPGAQAKTALLWHRARWCRPTGATPSTHILKLPLGAAPGGAPAFATSLDNEWLCARLLAAFGFAVAPVRIEAIGAHKVLISERTDRRWLDAQWWARLPLENLCQATGTPVHQTAEAAGGPGLARMLELLRGSDQAPQDRERLLAAVVVMWMLAVPDVSARRFALLLRPAGSFVLAPLTGVMSAWPVLGRNPGASSLKRLPFGLSPSGMTLRHDQVTSQLWLDSARRHALGSHFSSVLDGLAQWAERAIEQVAAELPVAFPSSVSGAVFEGVRRSARALMSHRAP